ncbi:MAG: trypsin-like serine protease [Henriciella sp.]
MRIVGLIFAVIVLSTACAHQDARDDLQEDAASGIVPGDAARANIRTADLSDQGSIFRRIEIGAHQTDMAREEKRHRECPPMKDGDCPSSVGYGMNSKPAIRGAASFQAQITAPENYRLDQQDIAADDWEERHYCGASVIGDGWAVTAAHCVDDDMVAAEYQIGVGMHTLDSREGHRYLIDEVICYCSNDCKRGPAKTIYAHDIALVRFSPKPGDLNLSPHKTKYVPKEIYSVQLSDDETRLSMISLDRTERSWNVLNGAELSRTPVLDSPWGQLPSTSNRVFDQGRKSIEWDYSSADRPMKVVELSDPQPNDNLVHPPALRLGTYRNVSGTFTPNEQIYLDAVARIDVEDESKQMTVFRAWDVAIQEMAWDITAISQPALADYEPASSGLKLLNDDTALILSEDKIDFVDIKTGERQQTLQHPEGDLPILENMYVYGEDEPVKARNLVTDAYALNGGKRLASITRRFGNSAIWIWNQKTAKIEKRLEVPNQSLSEKFVGLKQLGQRSRILTWTNYGTLGYWNLANGKLLRSMEHRLPVSDVWIFEDKRRALVTDVSGATMWDLKTGKQVYRIDHYQTMSGLDFFDDDSKFVTWSYDATARIWDLNTGQELQRVYHMEGVKGAKILKDNQRLLTWSADGTARITNIVTGKTDMEFDVMNAPPNSPLLPAVNLRGETPATKVSYLSIPDRDYEIHPKSDLAVFGWGNTQPIEGFEPYSTLQTVELQIMSNQECAQLDGMGLTSSGDARVHDGVFCAQNRYQKTCKGDSGGPLIEIGFEEQPLVGVVAWGKTTNGKSCELDGKPGVYTKVSAYSEWIKSHLEGTASDAEPYECAASTR